MAASSLAARRRAAISSIHVAAVVPFSMLHTSGMAALRLLWFNAIIGMPYSFPLTFDRLQYEFAKDPSPTSC